MSPHEYTSVRSIVTKSKSEFGDVGTTVTVFFSKFIVLANHKVHKVHVNNNHLKQPVARVVVVRFYFITKCYNFSSHLSTHLSLNFLRLPMPCTNLTTMLWTKEYMYIYMHFLILFKWWYVDMSIRSVKYLYQKNNYLTKLFHVHNLAPSVRRQNAAGNPSMWCHSRQRGGSRAGGAPAGAPDDLLPPSSYSFTACVQNETWMRSSPKVGKKLLTVG